MSGARIIGNRYQLGPIIARGSVGTVYRAKRLATGKMVALKLLHERYLDRIDLIQRFESESRTLHAFDHRHIVRYEDHGRDMSGKPYLVMELLEGYEGTELLQQLLSLTEQIDILAQLCEAVDYANQRGIVHRDLKWSNTLVIQSPARERHLKLIDFGVVKNLATELPRLSSKRVTATGAVVGSPYYASPEQIMDEALDGRSDVYSIGVMAYELLSGRRPFEGEDVEEICLRHLNEAPLPLARLPGVDLPVAIGEGVMTALAKKPEDRFSTALQLQRVLLSALKATRRNDAVGDRG